MRRRIRELILSEGIAQVQLSDGLINDLIDCGHIVSLKAGQPLVKVGDVNPDFYILISLHFVQASKLLSEGCPAV